MKYALQEEYWWFETHEYIDRKSLGWVQAIRSPKYKERPKKFHANHTDKLCEAKLYNSFEEAEAVSHLLVDKDKGTKAEVVVISDKRLFEAKLKGI